ncbi:MAG: leucine--tRNA ligase [Cytophagales bacterium]|nr:MAG: leucine--tRNA ligase [Cytophagales bacterium]
MSKEYNPKEIESKWQQYWQENNIYQVENQSDKSKYYVLDMFPYPSGAGLHVGHPLGYIATDIFSRYKKMQGFNVLHPMGFDSFGLPAEQYAIETGQHPAITTENNIKTFKNQLSKIGFNYDKNTEIQTSSATYYRWTQWIFGQLFNAYFDKKTQKAEDIDTLIDAFEKNGNQNIEAVCDENTPIFSAEEWKNKNEVEKQTILLYYRLAFIAEATVNWCPALGMVLANDEVKDGLSERGGHPVERKKMKQWMMRITAYADRLLDNLENLDWSDAVKEMQRNWIGKSIGCEIDFNLTPLPPLHLERGNIQTSNQSVYYPNLFTTEPEKWKYLKELARNHRKNSTEAENILWQELRNQKLGFKIRRQHAIEDFIVDFVSLEKKLVIEVDGEYHNEKEQKEYDNFRTWTLQNTSFNEIRFTNDEVLNDLNNVLEKIKNRLKNNNSEIIIPSPNGEGAGGEVQKLTAFTTRIDTIFGVSYLVLAPEHEVISSLTTTEQKNEVEKYVTWAKNRSELERQSEVKNVSGVFTGSYVINPFNQEKIPIWIADYVLAGYGTGVVMGVPSSDERDFRFAKHFNLPIRLVIEGTENMENPTEKKYGKMINSEFLNGLDTKEAIQKAIQFVENQEIGQPKVNFRLRDAAFSRQRYWGEPMPIYYKNGMPYLVDEKDLPLQLPEITEYKPTADGEPPLARAKNWTYKGYPLETTTMPGWAGSSWYFLRYMDSQNQNTFASKQATDYWNQVDLYVGGTEHAVGHLLYSRFWTNFLADRGFISFQEPFKKMINQGMIQGQSALMYRLKNQNTFISWNLRTNYKEEELQELHVDVNIVENNILNIELFKKWRSENENATFLLEDDKFMCGSQVEKMSKRWYNVVNPDDVIEKYSADTLRLYEMFLGPLEQYKPWSMQGIDGCHKFLKRLWRLFYDNEGNLQISNEEPTPAELKALHKCIKGVREDLDRYSFNTPVSKFMILATELIELKCYKKSILEKFLGVLVPYTPHICEELWQNALGYQSSIYHTEFPTFEEKYLTESEYSYPIQINGKMRGNVTFSLDLSKEEIEKMVVENELVQKYLEGNVPKKVIVVPKKIINVVV